MAKIEWAYRVLGSISYSIWGLSLIDLFSSFGIRNLEQFNFLNGVDKTLTTLTVVAGLVGLFVKAHHSWEMNKRIRRERDIDIEIKNEDLRSIRMKNDEKQGNEE